jgi:hypothetical protein
MKIQPFIGLPVKSNSRTPRSVSAHSASSGESFRLLAIALAQSKLKASAGAKLTLAYASTGAADVTLEVKKGSKAIAEVEGSARAVENRIVWSGKSDGQRDGRRGATAGPGRFTLILTASGADGQRATVQAKLTLTKKR